MSIQRAVLFSTFERYYAFLIAFISTVVISRLLTPAEVGAFSVAMSLAGVASGLRELGASAFLIRSVNIEKNHESCAFGMTLILGGGLGGALLASADMLGGFFGQTEVADLLRILSLNFFLLPFGTVNNALIQRAMLFDAVARISVIGVTLSFLFSVGLAWYGLGSASLAWGSVVLSCSSVFFSILWGPGPALVRPRLRGARELLRFGLQNTGLSVLFDLSARFPDFILGKMQGMAAAGLMSRAGGLATNVNDLLLKGLNSVALSYFSQLHREKGDPVNAHIRIAILITGLGWPAFVGLAFFAEPLTLALYGEQWLEIVWPLRILCVQMCLSLPFCFQYQLVMAKDAMAQQIKSSVIVVAFKLVALVIGAMWGVVGVAIVLVISTALGVLLNSYLLWPAIQVQWKDYRGVIRANLPIMAVSVIGCMVAVGAGAYYQLTYVRLILWLGPLTALWVLAGYVYLKHPLADEARRVVFSRMRAK